ncbi:hypothetical protein KP509_09G083400 [Ceratopteris richardii]|uniref:RING-type domain-containing protein n=1 Tax=Ceratopteris richardii TaxID=49495 RepID=A0A8T2U928_CERRI|nr:hypothetical protein KP509_09G083400 [Ceratopteris richardii]
MGHPTTFILPVPGFILVAMIPIAAFLKIFSATLSLLSLSSDDDGSSLDGLMVPVGSEVPIDSCFNHRILERILPSVPYGSLLGHACSGDARSPACVVCLNEIYHREEVCLLPSCRHVFHADCIRSWIHVSWNRIGGSLPSCPLCRVSFDLGSLQN